MVARSRACSMASRSSAVGGGAFQAGELHAAKLPLQGLGVLLCGFPVFKSAHARMITDCRSALGCVLHLIAGQPGLTRSSDRRFAHLPGHELLRSLLPRACRL